jgi:hypothetical protein
VQKIYLDDYIGYADVEGPSWADHYVDVVMCRLGHLTVLKARVVKPVFVPEYLQVGPRLGGFFGLWPQNDMRFGSCQETLVKSEDSGRSKTYA